MKKQTIVFVVILVLAIASLTVYIANPGIQEKVASFMEDDFTDGNIYTDLGSLSLRLDEEIMKGNESFTVYLKDMDVGVIDQINDRLDGVFGSGATYQQVGVVGNTYKKVTITIKRTTNYYVLKAYRDGETIPDNERKAQKLYQVVSEIMQENVNSQMTDFEKEQALHDYLVKTCRYSRNLDQPANSDIYRAYGALINKDAVCNGYAEALQLLFACAGIESKFVLGTADGISHAWNLVKLDNEWYHLDATWNDPIPDKKNIAIHSYFNVSDEILSKTHTWERTNYPESNSMDYNFYVKNQLYFDNFDSYKTKAYEMMVANKQERFEAVIKSYVENKDDMQFIFINNNLYETVNWQTFCADDYVVLILEAE